MNSFQLDTMNKKQLAAELKKNGLAASENKSSLKNRLRNHIRETVRSTHNEENDNSANDSDGDSANKADDTLAQVSQLEKELREKKEKLDALRRKVQSSTRNVVDIPSSNTNTHTPMTVAQKEPRSPVRAEVIEEKMPNVEATNRISGI